MLYGTLPPAFGAPWAAHCSGTLTGSSIGLDRPLPNILYDMRYQLDPSGRSLVWNTYTSLQPLAPYGGQPVGRMATGGSFTGVTCADSATVPTYSLSLRARNLIGSIPVQLRELRTTTWIDLSSNSLQGSLPAAWNAPLTWNFTGGSSFGFDRCTVFSVGQNNLTGQLPPGLGSAFQRTGGCAVWLDDNLFTGEKPQRATLSERYSHTDLCSYMSFRRHHPGHFRRERLLHAHHVGRV